MNISTETIEDLASLLCNECQLERELFYQKEVLAINPDFTPLTLFKRLDIGDKDYLTTLDMVSFFKDNKVIMGEAECYLLVAAYDSNKDGKLSYIE